MLRTTRRTRRGVTLVEMMVAAALSILGMWLLTWLYQQGADSFRMLRAQGDLTAQERMVVTIMTRDLQANHFQSDGTKPNNGLRLSDQRTDQIFQANGYVPPRGGYFRAYSSPAVTPLPTSSPYVAYTNYYEGADSFGFSSTFSTNHFLQFTMILPGGPDSQLFSAEVPAASGQQYFSTSAEVSYFLVPSGVTTPSGLQLYDLYRRQRICATTSDLVAAYSTPPPGYPAGYPAASPDAAEVMTVTQQTMRTLSELTVPQTYNYNGTLPSPRLTTTPFTPIPATSPRYGEDKILSNVLSFEVKFTGSTLLPSSQLVWPTQPPPAGTNSDYPYDTLPFDNYYDTHSRLPISATTGLPAWQSDIATVTPNNPTGTIKPIRITGVMIRIRAYESRTRSTRQTTFTVSM
jgi:hypothetical protein